MVRVYDISKEIGTRLYDEMLNRMVAEASADESTECIEEDGVDELLEGGRRKGSLQGETLSYIRKSRI